MKLDTKINWTLTGQSGLQRAAGEAGGGRDGQWAEVRVEAGAGRLPEDSGVSAPARPAGHQDSGGQGSPLPQVCPGQEDRGLCQEKYQTKTPRETQVSKMCWAHK